MEPIVSVIVPVYNVEKYVQNCIRSIAGQSFRDIEIIIVNDASPDKSLALCQKMAISDSRIIIIDKPVNHGLELARRTGLAHAKGKYVTHVDSDDWLDKKSIETMYRLAEEQKCDIVVGKITRVIDKFGLIKRQNYLRQELIDRLIMRDEFIQKYYKNFFGVNLFQVSMCAKLYRRSFIESIDVSVSGYAMGEDLSYNIQVFPEAKSIYFTHHNFYFYRFGGMTTKFNAQIINAALGMFELKERMIQKYGVTKLWPYTVYELKNYLATYINMSLFFGVGKKEAETAVAELISRPAYVKVIDFFQDPVNRKGDSFAEALAYKNIPALFGLVKVSFRKARLASRIKNMMSFMFS